MPDKPYETLPPRRRKVLNLRRGLRGGVFGVSYGMSAFGYPLGAITGVQVPAEPPLSTDQFGGADAGEGSGDAGSAGGDSGGAA